MRWFALRAEPRWFVTTKTTNKAIMIINRDFNRTEHDDYVLNVQKHLDHEPYKVATPLYDLKDKETIVAWKIHDKYE